MALFTLRGPGRAVTVAEVLERALAVSYQTMKSPRSYLCHCRRFSSIWGHRLARDLTREDVAGWIRLRCQQAKPSTVVHEHAFLSKAFRLAMRDGLVFNNPAAGHTLPRIRNERDRILLLEEEERLFAALPDDESRSLLRAAILTGMRRSELFGLRPVEVDAVGGFIRLPGERTKNGRERFIPIHPDLREDLARRRGRFVWWPNSKAKRTSVAGRWMQAVWQPALKAAGIEGLTFHGLRHTFASRLVMAGVDLFTVQTLLGHRDSKQTARYSHLQPGHLQAAVLRMMTA